MKINCSYLINTALSITVLTLTTLSANAKEVTRYAIDYNRESHASAIAVPVTDTHKENHDTESLDNGFMAKHTTEMEFTFAILVILIGLGYFFKSSNEV